MATFTSTGATNGAALIQNLYSKSIIDSVYSNNFIGSPWLKKNKVAGDTACRWVLRTAANGSLETFSEGQGLPAADVSSYANAAVDWSYFRAFLAFSGHARDALQSHRAGGEIVGQEVAAAAMDINDLMSTTFLGSSVGLELAIDSTSDYAGVTRAASSWFCSAETGSVGALAYADLIDMVEALADSDRGRFPEGGVILAPWNQVTNIQNLSPTGATAYQSPQDLAPHYFEQRLAGKYPIQGVGDLTDTVILFVCTARQNVTLEVIRPLRIDDQGRSGDADQIQVSVGAALKVADPRTCGKLTGINA